MNTHGHTHTHTHTHPHTHPDTHTHTQTHTHDTRTQFEKFLCIIYYTAFAVPKTSKQVNKPACEGVMAGRYFLALIDGKAKLSYTSVDY